MPTTATPTAMPTVTATPTTPMEPFHADVKRVDRVFGWVVYYVASKDDAMTALRHHFSDVCSGGDLCMQKLLDLMDEDQLDEHKIRLVYTELEGEGLNIFWETCWERMEAVLMRWLDTGVVESDPYWAD